MAKGKRVIIVDDHPLLREGLERLISSTDEYVVCGQAGDAEEAMAVARKTKPDLAVVDISLPGVSGIELTRRLTGEFKLLRVLILSMHEEAEYAERALEAGAIGYMVKHDALEKIGCALNEVANGRRYLSGSILGVVR